MERSELARLLGAGSAHGAGHSCSVEEGDPCRFMSRFAEAVANGGNVFLADPSWRATERAQLARFMEVKETGEQGWLMIPSGGASGGLKFARHDGATFAAAVNGFCEHFAMERVDSVCVLPLHHVSGLMAWMRSAVTGGTFIPWDWREIEARRFPPDLGDNGCISLVPTQLQRLLASAEAVSWLRKFRIIFVGGGPAWDGLLGQAARLELPLAPSYGATETAAMVAALKPGQFLDGVRGCGTALPHARIDIAQGGVVRIAGGSVFRGYFPGTLAQRSWTTGDLGSIDSDGNLTIHGRQDDLILTGGKKVEPAEIEAALRSSGEFDDVAVIGIADAEWGQVVVACHPGGAREPNAERVKTSLCGLASFKHPKKYVRISPWPRNAQGKINRAELVKLASAP